jgi:hypothetical protein
MFKKNKYKMMHILGNFSFANMTLKGEYHL